MKRLFTLLIIATCWSTAALAQAQSTKITLVQERSEDNDEFGVKYKINLSKLLSKYDNNSDEIKGLKEFISDIENDSLKRITQIFVTGYASPDGPVMLNRRLSKARADDFASYLKSECGMDKVPCTTKAVATVWSDCRKAVRDSSLPNEQKIMECINSNSSQADIQQKIETMPNAWSYFKSNILPPMRCVELHIKYNSWKVLEEIDITEVPVEQPCYQTVIIDVPRRRRARVMDDGVTGLLFAMPDQPLDYDNIDEKSKIKISRNSAKFKERNRSFREKEKEHFRRGRGYR